MDIYTNENIEIVNDFNYLGTIFNYTGSFSLNQKALAEKGLKALNVLHSKVRRFDFDTSTLFQLFDAFVCSILGFTSEIWGFSKSKEIERIHLKFCKRVLSVKRSTCNFAIYCELGRYPLYIHRYARMIKYWGKLLSSDNIIIATLYHWLTENIDKGSNIWCGNVKNSFISIWLWLYMAQSKYC